MKLYAALYLTVTVYLHTSLVSALDTNVTSTDWSTYRPNLYFGLRPRLPESLLTGLLWFGIQDLQSLGRMQRLIL